MSRPPEDAPPPPRVASWLLARLLAPSVRDAMLGDLAEQFTRATRNAATQTDAVRRAKRRYWRELVHAPRTWLIPRPPDPHGSHHANAQDNAMTPLLADLRFAFRTMSRRIGTTSVMVLTLALGIGASTAIFSAVYPILVKTLPYPDADQLTAIWERESDMSKSNIGFATFDDIARSNRSFQSVAAMSSWSATMTTDREPVQFTGQLVTPAFFTVLGVTPAIGRNFVAADNARDGPRVIILSHAVWRDVFQGDRAILEKPITLDGTAFRVIGVMPASFESVLSPSAQVWSPLRYNLTLPWACRTCRHLRAIARRRADVTAAQARAEIDLLAANIFRDHPTDYSGTGMLAPALAQDLTDDVRPALMAVLGAVLLVLLVASLNVSNLLIARGFSRRGEFAIRLALGAGRQRIVRQLLTESLLLSVIGGVLGLAIAAAGVRILLALSPPALPRLSAIGINGSVLLFAFLVTAVIGCIFGLLPAWKASRADVQRELREGSRSVARSARVVRSGIVVSEVALALVLLVGSGLLLRSMRQLLAVSPGFEPAGLLTLQVQAGAGRINNDTIVRQFYTNALDAVRRDPGVSSAAYTSQFPLSGDFDGYGVHIESRPNPNPSNDPSGFRYAVSDQYFETMRIPLVRGRSFTERDVAGQPAVAIVNVAFVKKHFGGANPIGERVRVGAHDSGPWREIVGVVGDVRQVSLEATESDAIYLPEAQWESPDYAMTVVVRAKRSAIALAPNVRAAIWSFDKNQPISRVATAEHLIDGTAAERRFVLVLFEAFAGVALALAAAGIYGVLLGSVTERTREFGIRAAFGATRGNLMRMVLRQGLGMTAAGLVLGGMLAAITSRAISGMLFGVSGVDPATYASVMFGLLLVAVVACLVPAVRAAGVDPAEALRHD